jgi:hypothetical protein
MTRSLAETARQKNEMAANHLAVAANKPTVTREDLVDLLNEDLAREYHKKAGI